MVDYTKAVLLVKIGREEEDKYILEFFRNCSDTARSEIIQVLKSIPGIEFVGKNSFIMPQIQIEHVTDCLKSNSFVYIISDQTDEAKLSNGVDEDVELDTEVEESDTEDSPNSTQSLVTSTTLTVKISKNGVVSLSKFDASVVEILRALNKDHRKYNRENMTWTISNSKSRKEFIQQLRIMHVNVEVDEDQNSSTPNLQTILPDVIIKIKSGVVSTSKYDAKVVELLKEINKDHRQYNKVNFTWTISDGKALQTLIENFKAMKFTVVEEA